MQDYAKAFYKSKNWQRCAEDYKKSVGYVCERCKAKYPGQPEKWNTAVIVHHKIHLTPENINDPSISLNWANLECVCRRCHAEEHPELYGKPKRYEIDEAGRVKKIFDAPLG